MQADLKKTINEKVTALKTAKDSATPDLNSLKTATEALSAEIQKIGQYMSQQGNNQAPNPNDQTGGTNPNDGKGPEGGDGNVKDAEFKEKK